MKSSSLIKLIFFLFFLIPLFGQSQTAYFERLLPGSNGNTLPVIHCISQDYQGFIWITSPYGLARFDGNEFLLFQHNEDDPTSLIDNYLFSVFEDSNGNLWFTTEKGLELLDKKSGHFIHFQHDPKNPDSLPSNQLRSISEDKDGYLWIGTFDAGICRFDPKTKIFTQYIHDPANPNSPSSNSIWAICCDQKGRLWIGTHEGLLDCYDKNQRQWTHYNLMPQDNPYFGDPNVWDLCEGKDGKIWIATSSLGLISLDPDSGSIKQIHLIENINNSKADHTILSLLQDQDGIFWIGTRNAGIFNYNPVNDTINRYTVDTTKPGSLWNNSVITIFEDREGLLWFGTEKGISLLNKHRTRFQLVQYDAQNPDKLSDNNIIAIYEDREGTVWISTAQGGLNIWDKKNNSWNQVNIPKSELESFKVYPIHGICEDNLGNLWFGNNNGLYFYNRSNKKINHIQRTENSNNFPPNFDVAVMGQESNGSFWIGTKTGKVFRWDTLDQRIYHYPNPQQKIYKSWYLINTIFVDSKGGVWLGTQWHGAAHLDPQSQQWIHYRYKTGDPYSLSSSTVYSIAEDRMGTIWVGTEAGPCYIDQEKQKWHHLSREMQLPDNSAYGLLIDESNRIWMSTNNGLIYIDQQTLKWRIYGPEDGIQNGIFNPGVCFKSRTGELYFGGVSGFNHFYPDEIRVNPLPPPVVITSFQKATQQKPTYILEKLKSLKITRQDLPLLINISALSYAFPDKNNYSLKSFDNDQTGRYLGTQSSFYLRDLKRGKNRFLIQGSNHDLVWNETGLDFTVDLTSPFYQSWLLLGVVLLMSGGAAAFLILSRRRRQQDQNISSNNVQKDIYDLIEKFNLTKREQEIIALVIAGKTNKDIQDELYISLKTVKTHLYNIYRKLNVKNRLQLMNVIKTYSTQK